MKQIIKLTEADLHNIVKEAVNLIINEEGVFGGGATNASYGRDLMWQKNPTLYNDGSHSKRVGNIMKITRNGHTSYLASDQTPQSFKPVEESINEIFDTPKGQAIAAYVFRRAKDRGLDAWEKDEPTEKYDYVVHQAFNTAKQHWDNPRNKEAFRFGDEQRKVGNSPQKALYNLKKRHQSMG